MAVHGYTKNYKLIKPQFNTDTWHDYEYDNLDTIDAVLSAIFASGDWKGFWKTNTHYSAGGVVIDQTTDTMYKVMVEHTTSAATFSEEQTAHPDYYELWSPNNLAESWAIKTDDKVSNTDYSAKAYAISSGLIDEGSAKEWATTASGHATAASASAGQAATSANSAVSSASSASTSATNAATSAELSQSWAVSDTLVNGTDYSAKHYANQANTNAANAASSATDSANSATSASASAQAAQNALNEVHGLIATPIGTIFQSVYVDESQDIARQLNGQLISSTKFTGFRSWLNTVQTALPNLFTTETNWQAEKTNSKLGQCGKFVVDDTAGTIRLPCVVNAQGLVDLALIGGIKSESLPNIKGELGACLFANYSGAFQQTQSSTPLSSGEGGTSYGDFNASRSSSTYQDNAPVQQEAVQYPYYIQVATGVEETLPAIREYEINTPFFFGQSMYSDVAPDNASWLASNGQYNAKTVYPDYYDWLVEQMNAGVDGFKGTVGYAWRSQTADIRFWTAIRNPSVGCAVYGGVGLPFAGTVTAINPDGTLNFYKVSTGVTYENLVYTESENINNEGTAFANFKFANDYDFIINTTDQTFRLPLKNGQEGIFADGVKGNGIAIGLVDKFGSGHALGGQAVETDNGYSYYLASQKAKYGTAVGTAMGGFATPAANTTFGLTTDPSKSGMVVDKTVPSGWNLYYYVGNTVQDASLINAGAVLGQLATKTNSVEAAAASMPSGRYINLTLGANSSTYTAPANGWFVLRKAANKVGQYVYMYTTGVDIGTCFNVASGTDIPSYFLPVKAGDIVRIDYTLGGATMQFRFIYAEGENNV